MEFGKWKDQYEKCVFPYQLSEVSLKLPPALQMEILLDPETPQNIIKSFADGSQCFKFGENVRIATVSHLNNDPSFLNNFKNDDSEDVRIALAANPNALAETLLFLAGDSSPEVRENVRNNPNATEEILESLAPSHGFVCISQSCGIPDTIEELKKEYPESNSRVTYSATPMKPRWASAVYRIESSGRLTFVCADYDSSD